jgi:ornithine cyclodeaminase/alanine dehydrogenase-like protein (mu-crystallin family)
VELLVLGASEVRDLLPHGECADVMRVALAALARGEAHQPLRTVVRPPGGDGLMALMPSFLDGPDPAYGLKAICIFPGNPALGKDAHQGGVLVSSARTGELLALVNGSALTEIRTAATSAVATSLLARPDAAHLAIVGAGVQARAHALAIAASRPLAQIRLAGHSRARTARLAAELRDQLDVPVLACDDVQEAVGGASIVVTATSSATPVLRREWLAEGTHINAVGACLPAAREIDTDTMADAALFVDRRESAAAESGDYLIALAEGAIDAGHIRAEIGDVLTGASPGRRGTREITLFESLGLAVEDLAAAAHAYRKACRLGAGRRVEF